LQRNSFGLDARIKNGILE